MSKLKKKSLRGIEIILWDFLMDCLKIHHLQEKRPFETIPEAQIYYAKKISEELKS